MELVGEKIYLRGVEEQDLDGDYFQWFNDAEICRYNSHVRTPNTARKMCAYWEHVYDSKNDVVLVIVDKASGRHIGNVSLQNIDWIARSAEFAVIIGEKDFWSKGVGLEAGKLIVNYGLERLNLRCIYCGTHQDNVPMQKLALALGMAEEGRRKQAIFKDSVYKDVIEYGAVKG
jgi:ribosomal-protein-alanine N-acetyltransferase